MPQVFSEAWLDTHSTGAAAGELASCPPSPKDTGLLELLLRALVHAPESSHCSLCLECPSLLQVSLLSNTVPDHLKILTSYALL